MVAGLAVAYALAATGEVTAGLLGLPIGGAAPGLVALIH